MAYFFPRAGFPLLLLLLLLGHACCVVAQTNTTLFSANATTQLVTNASATPSTTVTATTATAKSLSEAELSSEALTKRAGELCNIGPGVHPKDYLRGKTLKAVSPCP